jgi:twitching motility two-component system response regulator PilG
LARRVLLADDSVTAQNMGRRILIDAGYEVITVNNGSAALKKIAEHKPDLIIVDVYMPGYGGLEVCSRVKENKETSRIPVLLTVGKLEPFKPEEARKVRADAFIVKPFEASELLTALTKLEDKIVPGPEPYKPGRFAKALASVEGSAEKAESFGDMESGWKNRLTIPPPHMKPSAHAEPEPEVPKPAPPASRELGRDEDFKPAEPNRGFERPLPAGLPPDIRPEEIAAIAAAAAALRGDQIAEVAEAISQPVPVEVTTPVEETKLAETTAEIVSEGPKVEAIAAQVPLESKLVEEAQEDAPPQREPEDPAASTAEPEKTSSGDAEVLAALASLTPANGDYTSEKREEEPVTVAVGAVESEVAAVGASYTGPRWVAEAISVPIEEATRPLEQEMHKAFAAFAAADGLKLLMGIPALDAEEPRAEAAPFVESVIAVEAAFAAAAGASDDAPPAISQQVSAVEVVAPDGQEIEPRRESELAAAWENWRHIRKTIIDPETAPAMAESYEPVPESQAAESPVFDPIQGEVIAEVAALDQAPEPKPEESKVDEVGSTTAEVPIEETQIAEIKSEPETTSEPVAEVAAKAEADADSGDSASDPEALSSIVDDMLADLKPRLMEELSRKLSKSKKKKKS